MRLRSCGFDGRRSRRPLGTGSLSFIPAVLFVVAAGCTEGEGDPAAEPPERWAAEVELRIGSVDDPETALTTVGTVLAGADGRAYVAQPMDAEVRIHASNGELVGWLGGRGEGPGEVQILREVGWWGEGRDTIWTWDLQLRRVSLFTSDGSFVRSIRPASRTLGELMTVGDVEAILPDGSALASANYPVQALADGQVGEVPIVRFPLEAGEPEIVTEVSAGDWVLPITLGESTTYGGQPIAGPPLRALSGVASRVVVVERDVAESTEDASFRVTAIDPHGDTLWSREHRYVPSPISRTEADSITERVIESYAPLGASRGVGRGEVERAVRDALRIPSFRPPISGVLIADDGGVWVRWTRSPGEDAHRWWGFDAYGELLASLEVPGNVALRQIDGNQAWAVETDELDVPYVVRLRIGLAPTSTASR